MSRIALINNSDSPAFPTLVTDDAELRIYSIDENAPNDRVYEMGPGVERVTPEQFNKLISGTIGRLGDRPVAEQAVRAIFNLKPNGKIKSSYVPVGSATHESTARYFLDSLCAAILDREDDLTREHGDRLSPTPQAQE